MFALGNVIPHVPHLRADHPIGFGLGGYVWGFLITVPSFIAGATFITVLAWLVATYLPTSTINSWIALGGLLLLFLLAAWPRPKHRDQLPKGRLSQLLRRGFHPSWRKATHSLWHGSGQVFWLGGIAPVLACLALLLPVKPLPDLPLGYYVLLHHLDTQVLLWASVPGYVLVTVIVSTIVFGRHLNQHDHGHH